MIEVLRLNHRIARDKRISTHLALTSRALSVTKAYYSGQKDGSLEESVQKVVNRFGGPFEIIHTKEPLKLIKEKNCSFIESAKEIKTEEIITYNEYCDFIDKCGLDKIDKKEQACLYRIK